MWRRGYTECGDVPRQPLPREARGCRKWVLGGHFRLAGARTALAYPSADVNPPDANARSFVTENRVLVR
jgi:hypothetical protein